MHVVFYGPEGSGKGTQASLLAERLKLPVLVSGDLVREAAENDKGIIGETCRSALKEGKYVADSEMFVLWKRRLKQKDIKKGWIIDGFPRNIKQAKFLIDKVTKYGYQIDKVFYLNVSPEESIRRLLKRGRKLHPGNSELHDSPERIKRRLTMYHQGEKTVLKLFADRGILDEINGEQPVKEVHQDILERLGLR
jgi:adenylate kinase